MKVAAVQLRLEWVGSEQEFVARVCEPLERAVRAGAQLVVLPNYTGLMLWGILRPERVGATSIIEFASGVVDGAPERIRAVLIDVQMPQVAALYGRIFSMLAEELHIYLVPGTMIEQSGGQCYNAATLFAPDGKIVGTQRQTHRALEEIAWGLSPGDELRVFDVGLARLGLVVGTDVQYPEVSRILALQGANVLVHPAAYHTWSDESFLVDLWREVQSNQVFGVQACNVGWGYHGQSAIYAPVEMTRDERGLLAQAHADVEDVIIATLDFDALQRVVDDYPIFDSFNYEFYARELPGAYRATEGTERT